MTTATNIFLDNAALTNAHNQMSSPSKRPGNTETDRLLQQKSELLETGAYGPEDALIQDLDR